jgi:cytochrome c-type biogenesis protein CcmH
MLFWIVAGALAAATAALIVRPLLAPPPPLPPESPDIALYRNQLAEVDQDVARGVLPEDEAARARLEIERRLLAADRAGAPRAADPPRLASVAAAAAGAAAVVLGGLVLYSALGEPGRPDEPRAPRVAAAAQALAERPAQAELEARFRAVVPYEVPAEAPADYLAMVERLRQVVPTRPDDLEGWQLLALHEGRLGDFAASARAQARVVELKGEAATADDLAALLDRMVAAAGGLDVSPEAEAVLERLGAIDRAHPALRYYIGLLYARTGRPDLAFPLWAALIREAPAESFHRRLAEGQMPDVAWLAGRDWPPEGVAVPAMAAPAPEPSPGPTPEPAPGPNAAEIAAAAALAPEDRQAMIEGMVEGLAARLAAGGGPPADWARLVTSLAVLGQRERAAAILAEGRAAFADDPEALALLLEAERAAGLGG